MSDGPHKSLPMRPAWRRVAKRGDNPAYTVEEVVAAMGPALERDCRSDLTLEFINKVRAVVNERDTSLFKDDITWQIDALRPGAASSMESTVLDNLSYFSTTDKMNIDILLDATTAALRGHAARCLRQVEEHYLRLTNAPRAAEVRARLEDAADGTDVAAIAVSRILNTDSRQPRVPLKQTGIDDGVELP